MSAYVLLCLDITVSPPMPIFAGVFSSDAGSITMDHKRRAAVEVMRLTHGTYAECAEESRRIIATSPFYAWLRPLMDKGDVMSAPLSALTDAELSERAEKEEATAVRWMERAQASRDEDARRRLG